MKNSRVWLLLGLLIALVIFGLTAPWLTRPPKKDIATWLYPGITYYRQYLESPRPLMIHVVEVDLNTPNLDFLVTPDGVNGQIRSRRTSEFLSEFGLQIAINGGFFKMPEYESEFDHYRSLSGRLISVNGLAIGNGITYATGNNVQGVLCVLPDQQLMIDVGYCPDGTRQAVAGNTILIEDGLINAETTSSFYADLHPRTALALNHRTNTLWLIVVDGRQPGYSEGVTMNELAQIALTLGAESALNLDGGGSSTLVVAGKFWPDVKNSPIHTRIPQRQRPVATHFGIYVPQN